MRKGAGDVIFSSGTNMHPSHQRESAVISLKIRK